VISLFQYSLF